MTSITSRTCPPAHGRRWPRRHRRGLINVLLTVAVVAVVVVGILAIYGTVMASIRAQSAQGTLSTMEAELRRIYASQPQFEADLTPPLLSMMPTNAIQEGGRGARRIVTPWGGRIFAGGGDEPDDDGTGTASADRFYISVLNLPEAACERLAAGFLNRDDVVGLDVEGAGGTAFTQVRSTAQIEAFDTPTEITDECDGGGDDKIAIVFRG